MREDIGLFHGKRLDSDEWVEGYIYHDCEGWFIVFPHTVEVKGGECDVSTLVPVDPATVGEYTGLMDKNDKRIFEGDIIQFGERRLLVYWNGEAFQWQAREKEAMYTYNGDWSNTNWDNIDLGWIAAEIPILGTITTEIIGNIHDNPELLEM